MNLTVYELMCKLGEDEGFIIFADGIQVNSEPVCIHDIKLGYPMSRHILEAMELGASVFDVNKREIYGIG